MPQKCSRYAIMLWPDIICKTDKNTVILYGKNHNSPQGIGKESECFQTDHTNLNCKLYKIQNIPTQIIILFFFRF